MSVNHITKLGLIAGGGHIPIAVAKSCHEAGLPVNVAVISGFAALQDFLPYGSAKAFHIGELGSIGSYFRHSNVSHVTAIGFVRRVGLTEIQPNFATLGVLLRLAFAQRNARGFGDDKFLRVIAQYIESVWGFPLVGAAEILPSLLAPEGQIGHYKPSKQQMTDISLAEQLIITLSSHDVGQAVVAQQGRIMAIEAAEGTEALICRSGSLIKPGSKAVLIKAPKQGQDKRLDLPTIGSDTVFQAYKAGFGGIAVEAGEVQIADLKNTVHAANTTKLFLYGFTGRSSLTKSL